MANSKFNQTLSMIEIIGIHINRLRHMIPNIVLPMLRDS